MASVGTQSLIDNFTDRRGLIIERGNFLVVEHINSQNENLRNTNVAYSFYSVIDVKPNTMTYGFLFYGDQNFKNVPLTNYHFDRKQTFTVEQFNNIKLLHNVYIIRDEWQTRFNSVKDDWELNDIQGRDFHRRMSPTLEEKGPPPTTGGGKKEFKNFGGGGKKLTRKNRKHLMKLYRKNRTRKHRGGGKIDPNDTRIKLYPTQEKLDEAEANGMVQHYLRDLFWIDPKSNEERKQQFWMTEEEYDKLN